MYTLKYCQLCLVVDVRTFAMNTATLEAYSKLLQLHVHNKEPYICYECLALLLKYQEFHAKCLRAHKVLTHFKMQCDKLITLETFETQRQKHNLESKLTLSTILHDAIQVPDISDDKVNISCNINSINDVGDPKINMLHVKEETKPYVYVESLVAYSNEYSVIEETCDKKLIVTKDIQDTSISDLDDETSLLKIDSKQLVNIVNKTQAVELKTEIDAKDENNGISGTSSNFDVKPLSRHMNNKVMSKTSTVKLKIMKPKNYIDAREQTNIFSDTDISRIDEELLSDMRNSKELVDQATEIAKSILHDKYAFGKEENSITNRDLEDELLQKIGNSEELLKKASKIVYKLRTKSNGKDIDLSFYDGFARVVKMTPEEARKEILLRKETSNYLESVYKCELCYRGFRLEIPFDNHMKKHTEEYGSFECEYCHVMCLNEKLMARHINRAHKYKIFCSFCPDYVTCFPNQAKSHIRQHKGKTFSCDKCDAVYGRLNSLLGHKSKMHPREVVCALCGNTFGTQAGLTVHKNQQHRQASNTAEESALCGPRCDECAVQFATEAAYARHRALSHQQAASQDCEFCGETFGDDQTLRAHVFERHTQEQPRFCCAQCPFRFWDLKAYKSHLVSRHYRRRGPVPRDWRRADAAADGEGRAGASACGQKTYFCEYCGKDINILQKQSHTLRHTGEYPYKCKLCGKGFTQSTILHTHKATHVTTRDYQCDKCPKNYKLEKHLKRHTMTSHAGIRPHKCAVCGKSFPFPCELRTHVKYVHEKTPWPTRVRKRKAEPSLQEEMEN